MDDEQRSFLFANACLANVPIRIAAPHAQGHGDISPKLSFFFLLFLFFPPQSILGHTTNWALLVTFEVVLGAPRHVLPGTVARNQCVVFMGLILA